MKPKPEKPLNKVRENKTNTSLHANQTFRYLPEHLIPPSRITRGQEPTQNHVAKMWLTMSTHGMLYKLWLGTRKPEILNLDWVINICQSPTAENENIAQNHRRQYHLIFEKTFHQRPETTKTAKYA